MRNANSGLYLALGYIECNLKSELTLPIIAKHVGYTDCYLAHMFKRQYHISVMKYVQNRRMIQASHEILAGRRIIEVALDYGWDNQGSFSRAFRKMYHFSPSLLKLTQVENNELEKRKKSNLTFYPSLDHHASETELLQILKDTICQNQIMLTEDQIEQTYCYAVEIYSGVKRYSGDPFIIHPLNVSILLAEMEAAPEIILAGLFTECFAKTNITEAQMRKNLPDNIVQIVVDAYSMDLEKPDYTKECILIRLAERLHNMRTLEYIDDAKKKTKVRDTLNIFYPIANMIGNQKIIDELNHLSMKYF